MQHYLLDFIRLCTSKYKILDAIFNFHLRRYIFELKERIKERQANLIGNNNLMVLVVKS